MANERKSSLNWKVRRVCLTINNPEQETLERVKSWKAVIYGCLAEEIATTGTKHIHIYLELSYAAKGTALKRRFPTAHIEKAEGTAQECIDYVKKGGVWEDSQKAATSVPGSFVEWGERPANHATKGGKKKGQPTPTEDIIRMIQQGKTDWEILKAHPGFLKNRNDIEWARQAFQRDKSYKRAKPLYVEFVFGPSESGKTNYVMGQHKKRDIYVVSDHKNPFDGYMGEKVIFFDDFEGLSPDFSYADLVRVLDSKPTQLSCRGSNRWACFTHVYFASCDDPLTMGISDIKRQRPRSVQKLLNRVTNVVEIKDGEIIDHGTAKQYQEERELGTLQRAA